MTTLFDPPPTDPNTRQADRPRLRGQNGKILAAFEEGMKEAQRG